MEKKYGLFRGMQTGRKLRWIERFVMRAQGVLLYGLILLMLAIGICGAILAVFVVSHFIIKYW